MSALVFTSLFHEFDPYLQVVNVFVYFFFQCNAALGQLFSYSAFNPAGVGMYVESDFGVTVLGGTANKWARLATGLS